MALIFWLLNLNGISKHTHTHFMAHFIRQTTLSSSMVFGSRDLVLLQQMPLQCSLVQQQQFSCRGGDALATVKYLLTNHEDCRNRTATGTTLQKDAEELCSRMPLLLKRDFFYVRREALCTCMQSRVRNLRRKSSSPEAWNCTRCRMLRCRIN